MVRNILKNSFIQLLLIYSLAMVLIVIGVFSKFVLQFSLAALIIAIIGVISVKKTTNVKLNDKLHYGLLVLAFLLIALFRIIPYFDNSIPLGYDPGMYKYGIESGLENNNPWVNQVHEPGFMYLFTFLNSFLSTDFILIWLFIIINLILGISIYLCTKEYFDRDTALIAVFLYAFSVIQFKAFWYMYYRNIMGMALMLFAFYFLKKNERVLFILSAGLLGVFHRPTFYLFGLSYFVYAFIGPYRNKRYDKKLLLKNIINGVFILAIFGLFHIGRFGVAVVSMFSPVVSSFAAPGTAPGTFIDFFTYQYSILPYLIMSLFGFFYLVKKKERNILMIWTVLNASIVIFQLFFFNRFIIQLDLALVILGAVGFSILISENKRFGTAITIILVLCAGVFAFNESMDSKPLISEEEFNAIKFLSTTESDAFVMATSSTYSPWLVGYSGRKTIAPGLFDYNLHNESDWRVFWSTNNITEVKMFMDAYQKPLYVFIGQQQSDNLAQFTECFLIQYDKGGNKVYKYAC